MRIAEDDQPLGLASGEVRVVPYHAQWPALYELEAARLREALDQRGCSVVLEHSGSTAVPGLAAKPIIDILGGRSTETSRRSVIDALEAAGYIYRGERGIPGRDFFRRGVPRSYHIHVAMIGSVFWNDHRDFRDYLRANPEASARYSALKCDLALRFPSDRESYISAKTAFVLDILERARMR